MGAIAPRSQRHVKEIEASRFYIKNYIPDAKIYPVMVWIQKHARGSKRFFSSPEPLAQGELL